MMEVDGRIWTPSHLLQMRGLKHQVCHVDQSNIWSHLLQMRGLKQEGGALKPSGLGSHLLQMRGLKQYPKLFVLKYPKSHLLQMRGLKLDNKCRMQQVHDVASFTDAWIETNAPHFTCEPPLSHLLQMRGLKLLLLSISCTLIGRIFYRCVD